MAHPEYFLGLRKCAECGRIFLSGLDTLIVHSGHLRFPVMWKRPMHKHRLSKRIKPILLPGVRRRFAPTPGTAKPAPQQISGSKRIFIQEGDNCWIVRVADLMLLESEGNYTRIYFGESNPIVARSLNYMEHRLDPTLFFRANRKSIINLKYVKHIEPQPNGGFAVRLQSGSEIDVSRRKGRLLKHNMRL